LPDTRRWLEQLAHPGRAGDLAWVWDTQDEGAVLLDGAGRILDANHAACAMLGVEHDAMVGTTPDSPVWRRIELVDGGPVPPERRPGAPRARDAPELPVQLLAIRVPGRPARVARVRSRARYDGDALQMTLITFADVSQEVEAQRAVERIAESVEELLFTATAGDDGRLRIVYASPGVERLLGGAPGPDTSTETAWFRAVHPDDREIADASLRETVAGRPVTVEYRMIGLDGRLRWVRARTQRRVESGTVFVDGIVSDITATRRREEEVARFRAVVEASPSCIALLDLDWRVRWINPAGLELTGLGSAEAARGVSYLELVADEARAAHLAEERPTVAGEGRWSGESLLRSRTPGMRPVPVDATTYLIDHPTTGEPLGVVAIRRDVSVLRRLAREHEAIGNLATAIASGADRDEIFGAAAREAARLLDADAGAVARLVGGASAPDLLAEWHAGPPRAELLGRAAGALGGPMHRGGGPHAVVVGAEDHCLGAPVVVEGTLWGVVVACRATARFGPEDERGLERLAGLVGTAVGVAQARDLLVRQATTDGLTGLSNHRAFHDLLRAETVRARRYDRPLAIVLLDLDDFKEVNDRHGHQVGDALLRAVADALQGVVRASEVVARLGGDEFAVLLPETDLLGALATAERLRDAIGALRAGGHAVTASAGVADLTQAATADDLVRLADGALYWSKVHGRNQASVYDPEHGDALSAGERAERLARTHALGAVRVLARLVDLRDPARHHHAERVADVAAVVAAELGWPQPRCGLLHDAALLHDVGRIVATGPADEDGDAFARLGAVIAAEALSDEQAAWIGQHRERWDGGGPEGLSGEAIAPGARIIALADAWDALRTGGSPQALDACRAQAGGRFDPAAVAALERACARGAVV
jgi:diguanylate cyclase (GGDEF)-like protein/PAS domain S-box-containing protein